MFGILPSFAVGKRGNAFTPAALSSKLKLWLHPGTTTWSTSGRTSPETGTGSVGAWDDASSGAHHALQTNSALRVARRAGGGITTSGSSYLVAPAVGAWSGDFTIHMVLRALSYGSVHHRYLDVDFMGGVTIMQPCDGIDAPDGVQKIKASLADPAHPYGLTASPLLGTSIHRVESRRVGTTHSLIVDGGTPDTRTVTSAALTDTAVGIAARADGLAGVQTHADIWEIVIAAGLTSDELASLDGYFAARMAGGSYL